MAGKIEIIKGNAENLKNASFLDIFEKNR